MNFKRYHLVIALVLAILLTMGISPVMGASARYQAIEISVGKKSEYNIFILDSKDGHMWILETKESRIDGKLSGGLKYQGQLRPGKSAGEMIFTFGKEK
jgi:hypothetical protein